MACRCTVGVDCGFALNSDLAFFADFGYAMSAFPFLLFEVPLRERTTPQSAGTSVMRQRTAPDSTCGENMVV